MPKASVNQNWTEAYSMVWALALAEENQYKASVFDSLANVVITYCHQHKTLAVFISSWLLDAVD